MRKSILAVHLQFKNNYSVLFQLVTVHQPSDPESGKLNKQQEPIYFFQTHKHTHTHTSTCLHAQTCASIHMSLRPQYDSTICILSRAIKPEKDLIHHLKCCFVLLTCQETVSNLKLLSFRSQLKENDAVKWNCHL